MPEHVDVIVIGSGAGGGTVTWALAPTGKKILLLERGDWLPREIENWSPTAVWAEGRYHNSGEWTDGADGSSFAPKQNYYVGGNTKFYGAILYRFRERDFGPVQHVDGTAPAWPISYADLAPYYDRAERLYQVHGTRGEDPDEPPASGPYPWPAISDEPRIAQLREDLRAAGLHPFSLPNGILLDEGRPHLSACVRCATCDGYPCLVNGKADSAVMCVEPALRYPNVTLRTRSRVVRLETDPTGRSVSRVVVDRDGEREEYTADVVVLAAGAINSAALLLASAGERHPAGLGNGSGHVGRHLMLHNNSGLTAFSKTPNPTKFQKTLGVNDFYWSDPFDPDWGFPVGSIQMNGKSESVLIGFDVPEARDPADLARHSIDFWLTTEDLPLDENRVTVDRDGAISLHYTRTNAAEHDRLRQRLQGLLEAIRCEQDVYEDLQRQYAGGQLGIGGVAHQNGTIRFGPDPTTAPLDVDCRMHEVDNLYVADSSFFVSSTAVNPTLTIIANALRVADTVAERLGAPAAQIPQPRPEPGVRAVV
ncbi:GMC oxidoreductase [Petropleomorpha daqingensis]|uniref:Choline dehydrogenase-like flavoprotein n=1 Tax=Petropleomorpha daqingensis TaxID=2026353 RepID=A0A853CKG6_9ACTN|nr:GMC family oxidoreductase [Petropleomorpha daqingensis]NYJ08564.1 choline dehydrogenase-like flavoprotein [Petropleomorpha daqingensis]